MTIKFGNFANFIVRNFVVIWEVPRQGRAGSCCVYSYLLQETMFIFGALEDQVGTEQTWQSRENLDL